MNNLVAIYSGVKETVQARITSSFRDSFLYNIKDMVNILDFD